MVVERDDSPVVEGQAAEVRTAAARREDVLLFRQLRSGDKIDSRVSSYGMHEDQYSRG